MPKLLSTRPVPRRSVVCRLEGYEPVCLFAHGGMAQVFLARARGRDGRKRLVAIKTLRVSYLDDSDRLAMFADEMRLAYLLRHPHIVELVEAGVIEGEPFLVLEYIDGPSFRELAGAQATRAAPMDLRLAMSLVQGAGLGLQHAHELVDEWGTPLEVVHRDINQHNLMVGRDGLVKVVDFGVAKAAGQSHQTIGHGVKGKMAYAAPEYIRGEVPDRRADVFGLGVVLWELLTNERLFYRATAVGTMQAVVYDEPPGPSSRCEGVPVELDRLVLSALEKDPARRLSSAAELVAGLEAIGAGLGGLLPPTAIAARLAKDYLEILQDRAALAPEMSDGELSRGAGRCLDEASSMSSVEIDLSGVESGELDAEEES